MRTLDTGPLVVSLEPATIDGVLDCLRRVGDVLGVPERAEAEVAELRKRLDIVAAIEWDAVVAARPDVLLLLPCGFTPERTRAELPALAKRPGWADLPAVRNGRVHVLDGPAYFNRPGPRVVDGAEILADVLQGFRR
ncbi:ABC transporter substrate-binding protein [Amycolatopsis sp. cmx-8-4]|uniref:ABC transporter substrate-binding protein n=1 Tax=Amycolatopsis sp. cmx-8-4 TaxID=2790947 RepID=UPI003979D103